MKLDCIASFVATADAGSISEAARRLGLAKSVVSERLAELERLLDSKLVQRTTRKLTLTEDGHAFLRRARNILHEIEEGRSEMAMRRGTLVGSLRISAPVSFGVLHLAQAVCSFLDEYPGVHLTLELEDRFVDAAADGYDAVLRHGPVLDNRLVAKRIATSRRQLVGSPSYIAVNGRPSSLKQLAEHCGILYANRDSDWRFAGESGWAVVRPRSTLRVNNGLLMRDAVMANLGLALLPRFLVHEQLRAGSLVPVDVGAEAEGAELYIAHPRGRSASAKLIAFTQTLRRSFGDPPYWEI
jgi:DNA-binding transcriptional LysR family regulator